MSAPLSPLTTSVAGAFYEPRHAALADALATMDFGPLAGAHGAVECARELGRLHLLDHLVPGSPVGQGAVDVRAVSLVREALGQLAPGADAVFAVLGLASQPLVLAGSEAQRSAVLPGLVRGERVGAFALTEPEAGSDVASLRTTAERRGDEFVLTGEKTLISNVPEADFHVVFANADPAAGRKGITAFLVEATAPGLRREALPMSADHAVGRLVMDGCAIPASAVVGRPGDGFRLAMRTLDAFRITVGAAAVGMGLRALSLARAHVLARRQFGVPLAEQQMVKAKIADMATELEASRLLVARAAWLRDTAPASPDAGAAAAMAKMFATEAAFRAVDQAVQLHGGMGVRLGAEVERLAREVRPLRIYEGTTEIQKLVIAKAIFSK